MRRELFAMFVGPLLLLLAGQSECPCAEDSDGDGTPDCADGCPSDPGKSEPGACGCGVSDTDADADGVLDCVDNCPSAFNPEQADFDGDGQGDACDPCPSDPSQNVQVVWVSIEGTDEVSNGTRDNPYRTIQYALDHSSGSEEAPVCIQVLPGRYEENVVFDQPAADDPGDPANDSHESLTARGSPDEVVIFGGHSEWVADGQTYADRVIDASGVGGVHIWGFTITGGRATGGGGIRIDDANLTVVGNVIRDNFADGYGGGIYLRLSSSRIVGNTIIYNFAVDYGGGIDCIVASPEIDGNYIGYNVAANQFGGGIAAYYTSAPCIRNNEIVYNEAYNGGGISSDHFDDPPMVTGNVIAYNTAYNDGGGIFCFNRYNYSLVNNLLHSNRALGKGGGIYLETACSPVLRNVTIVHNTASVGGGVYLQDEANPVISNSIIAFNTTNGVVCGDGTCVPSMDHTDVYGNFDGDINGSILEPTWSDNNISVDPLFVDGYHLSQPATGDEVQEQLGLSPCVDAGSGSAEDITICTCEPNSTTWGWVCGGSGTMADHTTRTDGVPDQGTVDIGYHYPSFL